MVASSASWQISIDFKQVSHLASIPSTHSFWRIWCIPRNSTSEMKSRTGFRFSNYMGNMCEKELLEDVSVTWTIVRCFKSNNWKTIIFHCSKKKKNGSATSVSRLKDAPNITDPISNCEKHSQTQAKKSIRDTFSSRKLKRIRVQCLPNIAQSNNTR